MSKLYVGIKDGGVKEGTREIFRSATVPTEESHGYSYVIGPFQTVSGAKAMVHWGVNNPHMRCVREAEKIGNQPANKALLAQYSRANWAKKKCPHCGWKGDTGTAELHGCNLFCPNCESPAKDDPYPYA